MVKRFAEDIRRFRVLRESKTLHPCRCQYLPRGEYLGLFVDCTVSTYSWSPPDSPRSSNPSTVCSDVSAQLIIQLDP